MRLIDADKIQYAKDWVVTDKIPKVGGYNAKAIYRVTKEEIDAMPTVDAVPVEDVFELAIALSKGIEVLELPNRVYNALFRSAYYTVADVYRLWKSGNIKKMWNLGDKSIGAIEDRLNAYLRRAKGEHGQTD